VVGLAAVGLAVAGLAVVAAVPVRGEGFRVAGFRVVVVPVERDELVERRRRPGTEVSCGSTA
jgi:hypothetical protein